MIWEFQRIVGMPRIAAIEHPFGRPFGDVGDRETQGKVLLAALKLFEEADKAGYVKHLDIKNGLYNQKKLSGILQEPAPIILKLKKSD